MEHGGKIIPRGVRSGIVLYSQQLEDVSLIAPVDNDILIRSNSQWVNYPQPYNLGSSFPYARADKNPGQTATADTNIKMTFTDQFDEYGMWDNVNDEFVIPFDGLWEISTNVQFATSATGYRMAWVVHVNSLGSETFIGSVRTPAVSGDSTNVYVSGIYPFTAGHKARAYCKSSSVSVAIGSAGFTHFTAKYVGKI